MMKNRSLLLALILGACSQKHSSQPNPAPAEIQPPVVARGDVPAERGSRAVTPIGSAGAEADMATIDYEIAVDDPKFTFAGNAGHLDWQCSAGVCRARGERLNISAKSCVRLGTVLGVVISRFRYGAAELDPKQLANCRSTLTTSAARRAAGGTPQDTRRALEPGEAEYRLDAYAGQTATLEGGIRFVFPEGKVVSLRTNGQLFEFDRTRRIVQQGSFVEWNSKKGTYTAEAPIPDAIERRCRYASMQRVLKPEPPTTHHSRMVFCSNDQEEIQLVYRVKALAPGDAELARRAAFDAPYRADAIWQSWTVPTDPPVWVRIPPPSPLSLSERRLGARSAMGGAYVSKPYDEAHVRDMLRLIRNAIDTCYSWGLAYRPELQGQGELYLYFDQRGKLTTALIQRQTYVAGERFNACVEQVAMTQTYPAIKDSWFEVPFDVAFAKAQ